ncbi:S8 family serine peptidase [Tissierella sp. MB52-C2]|uniref:S8 family serine peptidase n=1 Tax=Tissierella sp. MB52-C2 TaxID=3070999 RepID=UPI00280B4C69|nr:S8 family serine peptidase [Tissierella sp. MB52-C2]WMM26777.1 S8 family serine peptidase [Tissierella sp. MB52-C2]
MSKNKQVRKVLSLIISLIMVLGHFTSFVYAENNQLSSAKEGLYELAADKISAEVKEDIGNEHLVEILIYMGEQVDTEKVAHATRSAVSSAMTPYQTKLEVRSAVVESLKDTAEMTQANVLKYLEQEMENGNVVEFTPYHIVNMVYVKATKEVIENLSYMPEVDKIYKNKTHTLENPEMSNEIEPTANGVEWNVEKVKADQVWDLGYDGTGIVVANIDSGVDWTHPALKNKWRGYDPNTGTTNANGNWFDPVYNASLPADSDDHGTHVMGTMVGQEPDGSNKIGVAPGAKWIAARVFNTAGSTTDAILLSAAQWMLAPGGNPDNAPDVVNNSWGGGAGIDDWYREAVRNWRAAEIFPAFAAGNQRAGEPAPWPGSISCPANYPESFAVAATDRTDIRAYFSKLGPSPYDESLIKPNISAPGVNVRSSIPNNGYGNNSGTSMATPAVAGVVALVLSANASLSVADVEEILQDTATPLTDSTYPTAPNMGYGYGLVDAFEAVSSIATGTGYISGRVLVPGEDTSEATITHEQEIFKTYMGSDIEILAEISDDVAITEAELLVKQQGKSYWMVAPMNRISGDHKNGMYKGTITHDMLMGDSIVYKIKVRDYAGDVVVTSDYKIDIEFGVIPGEYTQGFENNTNGWIFNGAWEWGVPSNVGPKPFEGEKLAATTLDGNYPNNADSWMITPPIDLRDGNLETASLRFYEWYEMENNYDKGYVLITNDYGETWTEARGIITGSAMNWKESLVNLGHYIGSKDPVFVAFRFTSDSSGQRAGWYIDNVRLMAQDNDAPAIPTNLTAEANMRGIKLNWNHSPDADLSHYNIYRSETSGEGYVKIGEVNNNSFIDSETNPNTMYYYVINAEDLSGNISENTEEVFATALAFTTIFGTDFENNDGGFTTGGTNNPWAWGMPTSGPNGAASGTKLWATNLGGNYPMSSDSYIVSPAIVLPEGSNSVLTFNHWVDMEGTTTLYDYGQVQISTDDGANWTNITPVEGGKYGRRVQAWTNEEISLAAYAGNTVKIRFFFHSDGSVAYTGWYIDDVFVMAGTTESASRPGPVQETELIRRDPKKADYIEPSAPNYKLNRTGTNNLKTIEDIEVQNIPMVFAGIPISDAVVTVLETGRSVKVDPVTGKFFMRSPIGEYTLVAEAYGYYSKEARVNVGEDQTAKSNFILEPKPQGTITGRVFDRYYETPAAYAVVRVVEDPKVAPVTADADGYFVIPNVLEGTYTLKVVADGFEPGETTVDVAGNETVDVNIGLKRFVGYEDNIIYDDGTAENALVLNAAPNGLAVRFTPDQFGKVKGTNIYFWDTSWPSPGGNRIGFTIYGIDANGKPYKVGEPIFQDVVRGEWNYIDLSSLGFSTDKDFYISTIQDKAGTQCPGTGIDENSLYADRSYMNIDGEFKLLSSEDTQGGLMIRARMEYAMDVPAITNLAQESYTNQDSVRVEGKVTADGKVNVYVNDVKVTSIDSQNREFAVEVPIPEERNTIKVTAELNEIETEPSTSVVVIKDKLAPVLTVDEPLDNAKINVEVVHVRGTVTDNIGLTKLEINDKEVSVDESNNFHERLMLDQGENTITVKATDGAGNVTTVVRTVLVGLESPTITNILPDKDISLREGDTLTVSFEAPTGGEGYFRLLMPFGLDSNEIGIPMTEEDGLYTGTFTAPAGLVATGLKVQVVYVSEYGVKVTEMAEGRVTVIGNIKDLISNTMIIGDEAFDMDFLDNDASAQRKLTEWYNTGGEVYIKLNDTTMVNEEGEIIAIDELPDFITYFDIRGNMTYYEK